MLGSRLETGDNPKPSPLVPVFLLFFEESVYMQGHYQSVTPVRNSEVLRTILTFGGCDVAATLNLDAGG